MRKANPLFACMAAFLFVLTGCSFASSKSNDISSAWTALYEHDFTYTITQNTDADGTASETVITGSVHADPYQEHQDTSQSSDVTTDIYYSGSGKQVNAVIKSPNGSITKQRVKRPYFHGYGEDISILSSEETELDGKSCIRYQTEYTQKVNSLETSVAQTFFIEKDSGKMLRIITDLTNSRKNTETANLMQTKGLSKEEAVRSLDWNENDRYLETIDITYETAEIDIPD